MLRSFFSYVPSGPPPEEPEVELPDPNAERELTDAFRSARRTLVAVCAVSIAWSTAQFGLGQISFDAVGVTVDLKTASMPLLLGAAVLYLTGRWMIEFAMMSRRVRRWPLAQLDFRFVLALIRIALLAVAAGALQQSLWTIVLVVGSIASIAIVASLLAGVLGFMAMPVRMWARSRANADSPANAAVEALVWGVVFAAASTVAGTIALAVASYRYDPLRQWLWTVPPDPIAFSMFMLTLNAVFLSHWLLRPVTSRLFAQRPGYRTHRNEEGHLVFTFKTEEREPLL